MGSSSGVLITASARHRAQVLTNVEKENIFLKESAWFYSLEMLT